jgi:hypothetical protein
MSRRNHPYLVISFDRSSSMGTPFGDGTRLSITQQAVRDVVKTFQGAVYFGYQEFPVNGAACPGGPSCCASTVSAPVVDSFDLVDRKMNECEMRGTCSTSPSTPTAEALSQCRAVYNTSGSSANDRFILLVTDGEPSCGRPRDMMSPCQDAIIELTTLNNDLNIKTAVVGVSEEVAHSDCLNDMASAGGMPRPGAQSYYAGRDPMLLRQYIGETVRSIARRSCRIDVLSSPPDPAETVTLLFDNKPVQRDTNEKNGWNFDGTTTVQINLFGEACDQLLFRGVREIKLFSECR